MLTRIPDSSQGEGLEVLLSTGDDWFFTVGVETDGLLLFVARAAGKVGDTGLGGQEEFLAFAGLAGFDRSDLGLLGLLLARLESERDHGHSEPGDREDVRGDPTHPTDGVLGEFVLLESVPDQHEKTNREHKFRSSKVFICPFRLIRFPNQNQTIVSKNYHNNRY